MPKRITYFCSEPEKKSMLIKSLLSVSFLFITIDFCNAQETDWDMASKIVVRFSPDSFPQLPISINEYLKHEGYTIPQSYLNTGTHNVIKGNFNNVNQIDWAVLASKNLESSILIFWNGSLDKVSSIAKAPDKDYLQKTSNGAIVFSRSIEVIGKNMIQRSIKKPKDNKIIIKEHSGINDQFLGKSASIHYLMEDLWYNFEAKD